VAECRTAEDRQRLPDVRAAIKEGTLRSSVILSPKTLYTTGCTSRRTQWAFSIATRSITSFFHNEERYPDPYATSYLPFVPSSVPFNSMPTIDLLSTRAFPGVLDDKLTCAESSNLPNPMDWDHWASKFGAGVRTVHQMSVALLAIASFLADVRLNVCRGQRICLCVHIGEQELWLAIPRLLWAFDIRSLLPDEPISLDEFDGESSRRPKPYRVTFAARHDRMQLLLEAEGEVTLKKL
jgi:hypothetical protein